MNARNPHKPLKNSTKLMQHIRLLLFILLLNQLNLSAQSSNDDIAKNLKNIFFNLNIDSCQNYILREIDSNKTYSFIDLSKVDTFEFGDSQFLYKEVGFDHCFKLNKKNNISLESDSILLQLQPAHQVTIASHGKTDYEKLYGHRVSILIYFHDSTLATLTYKHLTDSISHLLNKTYSSGDFTADHIVAGNRSEINIDRKNNGYEYERNLDISIRKYDTVFEVNIEFVKLTITEEICKE